MPSLKEVVEIIEEFAPLSGQEEWDNSGLLYGRPFKEIGSILFTLDLTPAVVAEAVGLGIDMIVEHHPSIFAPIKGFAGDNNPAIAAFVAAVQNDIAVYAAHTSVDNAKGGLNDSVVERLGCENLGSALGLHGYPKIGKLKTAMTLQELAELVRAEFADEGLRYVGNPQKTITKLAITNGGGASTEFLSAAVSAGAEVFITGDVKYHLARWTADTNYAIINLGHYESEIGFADLMVKQLFSRLDGVKLISSKKCYNPYD